MDRGTAIVAVVVVGALAGAQAPINARLGNSVGTLQAAIVSFTIGLAVLVVVAGLSSGGLRGITHLGGVPWWAYLGGACGAAIVSVSLVGVRTLGAGGVTAAIVAGQLTASVAIDALGLFDVDERPITAGKVAGIALLAAGVLLVVRD